MGGGRGASMAGRLSATDVQWRRWSRQNPYFGVLRFETPSLADPATRARFFATGEHHIATVMETMERHFGGVGKDGTALDLGCGVGRLLAPLARRFARVVAVDIAPDMLAIARENTREFGNIDFVETGRLMAGEVSPVDFVHTVLVLQHVRVRQGMEIIARLLDVLAPGGRFAIHITVGDRMRGRALLNWFRYRVPPLHWLYNLVRGRPWTEPVSEMMRYPLADVVRLMQARGCREVVVVADPPDAHRGHVGVMLMGRVER